MAAGFPFLRQWLYAVLHFPRSLAGDSTVPAASSILVSSEKVVRPFFVVYSFVAILGANYVDIGHLCWDIADTFNGLMAIPNLIALFLLFRYGSETVEGFFSEKEKA